jgi:RimJ/RimL family protein N-acetyltransferase
MKFWKNAAPEGLKSLKGDAITGEKVRLREKKLADARNDYRWQSDAELARLDATRTLVLPFSVYLMDYATEIRHPRFNRYPLAIETLEGRHIGNCTCYDISKRKGEAQLGIMIGDRDYWDRGYGADAVTALTNHVFLTTGFIRLYLKTLDWNLRAQKCFLKCGFTPCGEMKRNGKNFLLMELKREAWEKRQNG